MANHLDHTVLYALRRSPDGLTAQDLADLTGEPLRQIRTALDALTGTGTIERFGRAYQLAHADTITPPAAV